jgi:hypothetical protein
MNALALQRSLTTRVDALYGKLKPISITTSLSLPRIESRCHSGHLCIEAHPYSLVVAQAPAELARDLFEDSNSALLDLLATDIATSFLPASTHCDFIWFTPSSTGGTTLVLSLGGSPTDRRFLVSGADVSGDQVRDAFATMIGTFVPQYAAYIFRKWLDPGCSPRSTIINPFYNGDSPEPRSRGLLVRIDGTWVTCEDEPLPLDGYVGTRALRHLELVFASHCESVHGPDDLNDRAPIGS